MLRLGSTPVALMVFWLVMAHGVPLLSQEPSERVWLAGRYDRARVIIYFEAVQFRGAFPRNARNIAEPAADIMFPPQAVPADSLALLQKEGGLEPFAIGDRYDLMLDTGHVATMTLTTLIAAEGDSRLKFHVLTAGRSACELGHDTGPPRLLSALEIGGGRTGFVVDFTEYDGRSLQLFEYEDGKNFDQMRTLWLLSAGE